MAKILDYLANIDFQDKQFVGTIAFKSEEIALPDGSKMALGIDDGHWVLINQPAAGGHFQVYGFDSKGDKIFVDQKPGGEDDLKAFKKLVNYFLAHASSEDLVTILPPQA